MIPKQPKSFDIALLDADEISYAAGFSSEPTWYKIVIDRDYYDKDYKGDWREAPLHLEDGEEEPWFAKLRYKKAAVEFCTQWKQENNLVATILPEKEIQSESIALYNADQYVKRIKDAVNAEHVIIYFSGENNFRNSVATLQKYKGNRDGKPRPVHLQAILEHLKANYQSHVIDFMEADDVQGIAGYEAYIQGANNIVCAKDKDLNMIPGWRYIPQRNEILWITPEEASKNFTLQLLKGDSEDNIPGLSKLTGRSALKSIKDWCMEPELLIDQLARVYYTYWFWSDWDWETTQKNLYEIQQLLWINRSSTITWMDPYGRILRNALGLEQGQENPWLPTIRPGTTNSVDTN